MSRMSYEKQRKLALGNGGRWTGNNLDTQRLRGNDKYLIYDIPRTRNFTKILWKHLLNECATFLKWVSFIAYN